MDFGLGTGASVSQPQSDTNKQGLKALTIPDAKIKHREEKLADRQRQRKHVLEEIRSIRQRILEDTDDDLYDSSSSNTHDTEPSSVQNTYVEGQNMEYHVPTDEQGFQLPRRKNTLRKKTAKKLTQKLNQPLTTTNKYATLAGTSTQEQTVESTATPVTTPKEPKVPPIVIYNCSNHVKLCRELKEHISGGLRAAYTGDSVKFYVDTLEDYQKVFTFCQDHQIPFHTYQDTNKKELKVVVKDLPPSVTSEEVREDLVAQGFTIKDVHQYKRKRQGKLHPLPVYAVTLPRGDKSDSIYAVRYVQSTKVRVEDYRSRNEPSQCKRCQRWTHTTNYCWLPARCVKCGDMHPSKDCTLPAGSPSKCANCQGAHTASWKGCSEFQKALKKYRSPTTNVPKTRKGATTAANSVKLVVANTTGSTHQQHLPPPPPPPPAQDGTTVTDREDRSFASVLQGIHRESSRNTRRTPRDKDSDAALTEVTTVLKFLSSQNFLSKLITAGKRMLAAQDKLSKIVILVETLAQLEGSE